MKIYSLFGGLLGMIGVSMLLSCEQQPIPQLLPLWRLNGEETTLSAEREGTLAAVFFLSPECPLCENYSTVINAMRETYPHEQITFFGVFPGRYYDKASIQAYLARYHPQVSVLLDPDYALTQALGATVTPEVYLLDGNWQTSYAGPIDNWIPKLGVKRTVITAHYLAEAIESTLAGEPVSVPQRQPIGCFIE